MIRHKIIAQHFGTDKNYDEILGDNAFNEKLRKTLNECLREHLSDCINWHKALFFHPTYSQCGGMTISGRCCSFNEYKKTFYTELSPMGEEACALIVAGMVYAIFSVQEKRIDGTSEFLDDLERFLDNYNFFHHFKELVEQTESRYIFNFSIKLGINEHIYCWELDDFSDALQISVCGNFVDTHFYDFLNLPWRDKSDQLVVLEMIKDYFEKKYRGKKQEVEYVYGEAAKEVLLDDSFYPLYEEAKIKIESELINNKFNESNENNKVNNSLTHIDYSPIYLSKNINKTDMGRIIYSLCKMEAFNDNTGKTMDINKVFIAFGEFLHEKFSRPNNYSKQDVELPTHLEIFDSMSNTFAKDYKKKQEKK